uniref:Uncharacterized protein n=1 Tax=Hyaloperonospora arabidopsidis (strain Emoy2) TaxID=559515 RepID=M4B2D8_HYAAE
MVHSSKYDLLIKLLLIGDSGCLTFTVSLYCQAWGRAACSCATRMTRSQRRLSPRLDIRNWMTQIRQNASSNVNKVLIGNKCDVDPSERAVTTKQGQDLANEFGIEFFETSAKSNQNIEEAFRFVAVDIQKRLAESEHDRLDVANGSKFRVDESQDQAKDGCCS